MDIQFKLRVKLVSINQHDAILWVGGFGNKVRMEATPGETKPPWGNDGVKVLL